MGFGNFIDAVYTDYRLTVCDPPGYHFSIMTRRCCIFVFLKQTFAGRVSPFNKPDRSAGWQRAE